jgi:Ca2+-binding EF-hand superfamily protein
VRRPGAVSLLSAWLIVSGCCAFAAPAHGAEAADVAGDVQDLFFLGGAQPLLVRFHIQVGGRPLTTAWREAVANLHEYLDFNGAGTVGRDEDLADLVPMLRGPIGVRMQPASASESGLDTTFARLDANGDGKLDAGERENVAKSLRRFDLNDDESITSTELSAFRDPNSEAMAPEPGGDGKAEALVLLLDRSGSRIRAVQQVLSRFDTGGAGGARAKDHRLARSEIRLASEVFRVFDKNHDGALDSVELMEFLDRGDPAIEMIVRLGPRPHGPGSASGPHGVEVVERARPTPAPSGSPVVRLLRNDETVVTVEVGDVRIDVRTVDTSWDRAEARQVYDRLFYDVDLDDSKSVSLAEARGREPFQALFRLMDRNGDGQIVNGEMTAALALFEGLWRGHALLGVKDRGGLMFGNLDVNGDDRLGLRELGEGRARSASFDRNGDGEVTAGELPHRFELSFSQASSPMAFVGRDDLEDRVAEAPKSVSAAGPRWFQRMDRNHDGDLSFREFLGPNDAFLRLDADGDGLIDVHEAAAARVPEASP